METKDIFQHLIGVEHEASDLVENAQKEAGRRIDVAKKEGNDRFRAAYDVQVKKREEEIVTLRQAAVSAHDTALADYHGSLEAVPVSESSFTRTVDQLISGEV